MNQKFFNLKIKTNGQKLYEFTEFIEDHPRANQILDSSELPCPKEEILNAFIVSIAFG